MKRSRIERRTPMSRGSTPMKRGKRMRGIRIDFADKYFSLWIRWRAGWKCQRCLKQFEVNSQGLHCSHFWGRAREATRFDPDNCVAHCHGCHSFLTANPELHREWKLKQIGQREYDKLMIRAHLTQKKDRTIAAIYWKQRLAEDYPQALK